MKLLAYVITVLMWTYYLTFRFDSQIPADFWAIFKGQNAWIDRPEYYLPPKQPFNEDNLPPEFLPPEFLTPEQEKKRQGDTLPSAG